MRVGCFGLVERTVELNVTVRWGLGGIERPVPDNEDIKGVRSVELDAMTAIRRSSRPSRVGGSSGCYGPYASGVVLLRVCRVPSVECANSMHGAARRDVTWSWTGVEYEVDGSSGPARRGRTAK